MPLLILFLMLLIAPMRTLRFLAILLIALWIVAHALTPAA